MTTRERFQIALHRDEYGNLSPELRLVSDATYLSAVAGILFGAYSLGSAHYRAFIAENRHTMFENPFDAQAELQRSLGQHMARGAFKWGVRLGGTAFLLTSVTTALLVYRNKVQ